MNPYKKFLEDTQRALTEGKEWSLGGFSKPPASPVALDAPTAMIISPHPDDECIIGGLALRLKRELGFRAVNLAVTLGRIEARRAGRWAEVTDACHYLDFELASVCEGGLKRIEPEVRSEDPDHWRDCVELIRSAILRARPRIILFPHAEDQNTGHMGVHLLVNDALEGCSFEEPLFAAETEFWSPMRHPNLLMELGVDDLTDLLTALSFHVGEVRRNPYHLRSVAWFVDNVRRGGEIVGVQGGTPPDFPFGINYRWRKWTRAGWTDALTKGTFLSAEDDLSRLFSDSV